MHHLLPNNINLLRCVKTCRVYDYANITSYFFLMKGFILLSPLYQNNVYIFELFDTALHTSASTVVVEQVPSWGAG